MNEIAVFSAILGGYEEIKNNQNTSGADFYLFTDTEHKSIVWNQRPATKLFTDPRRNARWHKINSILQFPQYRFTIWIDGSMEMRTNAKWLVQNHLGVNDIAVFKHPLRNDLYDEGQAIVGKGFEDGRIVDQQLAHYEAEKYPHNNGLGETKCVIRRNCPQVANFEMIWNNEVTNYSKRDQISFNYAVWKAGLNIAYIPVEVVDHLAIYPNFNYIRHERT